MTLYRAMRTLSNGTPRGNLTSLPGLSAEEIHTLEKVGAVAPVSAPPLDVIPAWRNRAKVLTEQGIRNLAQVIEADDKTLIACGLSDQESAAWKHEAAEALIIRKFERP